MATRAPARRRKRKSSLGPQAVLGMLAFVIGIALGGTSSDRLPPSEARDTAARVAAQRLAFGARSLSAQSSASISLPAPIKFVVERPDQTAVPRSASHIRIPSVGIDSAVISAGYIFREGRLEYETPRDAAAHYTDSAAPGENGNVVIAGHVSVRSGRAVFQSLPNVAVGDEIEVYRGAQLYRYVITELRIVPPTAIELTKQTREARLTLITCLPGREYRDRFVVLAKPA